MVAEISGDVHSGLPTIALEQGRWSASGNLGGDWDKLTQAQMKMLRGGFCRGR